jgi:hypothetical protein
VEYCHQLHVPQVLSSWARPPIPFCVLSGGYVLGALYSHWFSNALYILVFWWWPIGNTSVDLRHRNADAYDFTMRASDLTKLCHGHVLHSDHTKPACVARFLGAAAIAARLVAWTTNPIFFMKMGTQFLLPLDQTFNHVGITFVTFGPSEYSRVTHVVLTILRVIFGLQRWMYLTGSGTEAYADFQLPPNARLITPARLRHVSRLITRSHWPAHAMSTADMYVRTSWYSWLAEAFKRCAWVNELCKFLIYSGHTTWANPARAPSRFLAKKTVLMALMYYAPRDGLSPKHSPNKDKCSGPFPLIRKFLIYSEPSTWANAARASPRLLAMRAILQARQYEDPHCVYSSRCGVV